MMALRRIFIKPHTQSPGVSIINPDNPLGINPDNPLGTIQCDFIVSVRPELVEGLVLTGLVVRRAHHERPNGLSGINLKTAVVGARFIGRFGSLLSPDESGSYQKPHLEGELQLNIRFARWFLALAILIFFPAQTLASSWQQSGTARITTEVDTNPTLSSTYPTGIWRTILVPSYTLKKIGDVNELSAGLSAQIARASNKMLSQDRNDPSSFLDWRRKSGTGEFGLTANYDEVATRIAEINNTDLGYTDGTRSSRTLSGNWSNALTERSTLALNGAYNDVTYQGGTYIDYVTRSGSMNFNYALGKRGSPFIKMSYKDTKPTGSNTLTRFASALVGWNWEIADYLDASLQVGKSKTSGTRLAKQAVAEVKYTGQRSSLVLNADRQVSASGLGDFVVVDQIRGGWSYALGEFSNIGIDSSWSRSHYAAETTNRTSGVWLQLDLNSYCSMRAYYQHRISERGEVGAVNSDMLGYSLVFSQADF